MEDSGTKLRYLEDIEPGERVEHGEVTVEAEDIVAFARRFDPQPFHLDPVAAEGTVFGGLAASGWHTAGLTMRLLVEADIGFAWGIVGRAIEQLEWPRPTRPGDTLRVASEVLDVVPSRSKPGIGIVRTLTETLNQRDEVVQRMVSAVVVPRRAEGGA
jgi:acyl dehydratase